MTKLRQCDNCKKEIKGAYIKCCLSQVENKKWTLNHAGDLCIVCWTEIEVTKERRVGE